MLIADARVARRHSRSGGDSAPRKIYNGHDASVELDRMRGIAARMLGIE